MEIGRRDSGSRRTLSQINVTPFVDVMLVLLVIFMVTAPMMEKGVDIRLPEVAEAPNLEAMKDPVIVSLDQKGELRIGRSVVPELAKLAPALQQVLANRQEKEVFLEADRQVAYGEVVKVMAEIKKAGVEKLGMVAEEPKR